MSDKQVETGQTDANFEDTLAGIEDLITDDLMVPNKPKPQTEEVKQEEPKTEPEAKPDEESEDDYLADVDADEEEEGDTPEDESETDEKDESEEGDDTEVVLKVDGEELTVTMDELKKGYSRQADYTKKTQQLAEERKALEEESKTLDYLKAQREIMPDVVTLQQRAQRIQEARQVIENGYYEKDGEMVKLSPEQIAETKKNVEEAERDFKYDESKLMKKAEGIVPPRIEELKETAPDLFSEDLAKRQPVLDKVSSVMKERGYSQIEIEATNDPRTILDMLELSRLRELETRVEKAKERRKKKPGVVSQTTKPSAPKGKTPSKTEDKPKKDFDKLAEQIQSGDMSNIGDFLEDVI